MHNSTRHCPSRTQRATDVVDSELLAFLDCRESDQVRQGIYALA